MRRFFLTGLVFIGFVQMAPGQQFENIKAYFENDLVTIYYDLSSTDLKALYQVDLYSSHDNYTTPLHMLKGDAGGNITPGRGKSITWMIASELHNFDGLINFELRGRNVQSGTTTQPTKLIMLTPNASSRLKAGKTYPITWSGGGSAEHVSIYLYRKKKKVYDIATNWANEGAVNFTVPTQLGSGGKYWIGIMDVDNPESTTNTPYFRIKNSKKDLFNYTYGILGIATLIVLQISNNK